MISTGKKWLIGVAALSVLGVCDASHAITLHTTDFIPNVTRTNFNGFEGIPATSSYSSSYTEDGIKVEQVNGEPNDIWTTYLPSGFEGERSWYASGGDFGFTKITRLDNSDFVNLGLLRSSGWGDYSNIPITYVYELLKNGVTVFSGNLFSETPGYLGFSGGGFNELRLGAYYYGSNPSQTLSGYQALAIDSIELSGSLAQPVPTPALLPGLVGVSAALLRKRKQNQGQEATEIAKV